MIRNDVYTIYEGKEYCVGKYTKETVNLISIDEEDIKDGFKIFSEESNLYRKTVLLADVKEVFLVQTFGIYKNHKFRISMEKDEQYLLWTSKYDLVEKYDLDIRSQGDYEKWVKKEDVADIYEIKKTIADYFE